MSFLKWICLFLNTSKTWLCYFCCLAARMALSADASCAVDVTLKTVQRHEPVPRVAFHLHTIRASIISRSVSCCSKNAPRVREGDDRLTLERLSSHSPLPTPYRTASWDQLKLRWRCGKSLSAEFLLCQTRWRDMNTMSGKVMVVLLFVDFVAYVF